MTLQKKRMICAKVYKKKMLMNWTKIEKNIIESKRWNRVLNWLCLNLELMGLIKLITIDLIIDLLKKLD